MNIQIRPAIYGFKTRYEAYEVTTKFSWWAGSKTTFKQLHFGLESSGWAYISEGSYYYSKDTKGVKVNRSFSSLLKLKKVLDQSFGNSYDTCVWRGGSNNE